MRVFVTGATGFVGAAVTAELIGAGHQVLGLTRSEAGAEALAALGAQAHPGSLEDLASLKAGAAQADGVIHLAFNHDFSTYQANCEDDRRVVAALAGVLAGSDRPLLVTSGTGMSTAGPGKTAREDDPPASSALLPRAASEEAAQAAAAKGVNVGVVRLPQVHDTEKHGLITYAIELARAKGVSAYVGEGANRWTAAHVSDTARLYRLALERGERGARYHAIAEEGIAMRAIAEAVGRRVGVPARSIAAEEAPAHFGWMAMFATHDVPASSALTREKLGWTPTGPGLIADIEAA
ncbi:SDR family oxidoreductase [Phenylobacterium sp. LjRoot164]|uniref:SDR family oxidoreductase n=1 Tax=unclassified Phenylobacterium TaxID=2640670 RepID=UPI003ECCD80D